MDCTNLQNREVKIGIISNIFLKLHLPQYIIEQFGGKYNMIQIISLDEYNAPEKKQEISIYDLIVVWIDFNTLFCNVWNELFSQVKKTDQIEEEIFSSCVFFIDDLLKQTSSHVLWFLFEDYSMKYQYTMGQVILFNNFIEKINSRLYNEFANRITFIELKKMVATVGIPYAYDMKGKYRWNSIYSSALLKLAAREIYKQYLINKGVTKKCLVLDCDNVLWGGVISEVGIENVYLGNNGLGRSYQDFQRYILSLFYSGVIITICSKNDYSDVITVFREHNEMVLKEENIACFEVNWKNKATNICKIAQTLNISLDSMVFIDDSPFEIENIKFLLPQVTTVLYERENVYEKLSCFNLRPNLDVSEIKKRMETYHTNEFREKLKNAYTNYDDFLNSLDIKIEVHEAGSLEMNRISELSQRTNKRTNGKRYSVEELKKRYENERISLYSVFVSDRFSNLGLVGALEVEEDTLTLFSLSCRALGRNIEQKMLEYVNKRHLINKIEFYSTYQNVEMESLFLKCIPQAYLIN